MMWLKLAVLFLHLLHLCLIYVLLNENITGKDIDTHKQDVIINLYFVIFGAVFYPEDRISKFLRDLG